MIQTVLKATFGGDRTVESAWRAAGALLALGIGAAGFAAAAAIAMGSS